LEEANIKNSINNNMFYIVTNNKEMSKIWAKGKKYWDNDCIKFYDSFTDTSGYGYKKNIKRHWKQRRRKKA